MGLGPQADDCPQSTAHLNELQILFSFVTVNNADNQIIKSKILQKMDNPTENYAVGEKTAARDQILWAEGFLKKQACSNWIDFSRLGKKVLGYSSVWCLAYS